MTLPNELHPGFFSAAGGDFAIDQSLRFKGSNLDFQYTPSTTGSRQTWTWATWIKRSNMTGTHGLLGVSSGASDSAQTEIRIESTGMLALKGWNTTFRQTAMRFRDPNAWYHIVVVCDITNSTANDRIRFFVNGKKITDWDVINNPGTSDIFAINYQDNTRLGLRAGGSDRLDGYLAETYFIDGTAISDTNGIIDEFGEYNTYGVWVPKAYTGSFGPNNGYHLKYDSSGYNGSGGIGADHSGSGNNFTATNFDTADARLYSKDLYSMTTGSGNWATTTSKNWSSFTPPTGFNGNLGDAVQVGSGDTWVWRPSYPLTATLVEVYPTNSSPNQKLYFNGTEVGGSYTGSAWNTVYTGSATTVNHIGGEFTGGGNGFYGIRVNGTILIDNPDTDVDYFDTPTSNYSTLNPLNTKVNSTTSISNGNLRITATATNAYIDAQSTQAASEFDCYCEATVTAQDLNGIGVGDRDAAIASGAGSYVTYREDGTVIRYPGNTTLGTHATYDTGDVLGMTATSTQVAFYKNGTLQGTYNHTLTGDFFAIGLAYNTGATSTMDFNFGQMPFLYTVPTGFKALQSKNLADPTIKDSRDHFEPVLWSGNDVDDRNITTTKGFAPDLVWIKSRSTGNHGLFDTVRGATKRIMSLYANAEDTQANDLQAFNTDGFQVGTQARVNASGQNYVAWCWKAGGATVLNQSGTIDSQVSANTDAGFSIISFTGNETASTQIGHGLTQAPEFVITKKLDNSGNWNTYHASAGSNKYLALNLSDMAFTDANMYNGTTSTVVNIGSYNAINANNERMIMYAWHSVENYSKFGGYTGNGNGTSPNSDGPYIHLGFKPSLVMVKRTDSSSGGEWSMYDSSRSVGNPNRAVMSANNNTAETTMDGLALLSNGFKVRGGGGTWVNVSGATYVYMAWAESPFGSENLSPATAR